MPSLADPRIKYALLAGAFLLVLLLGVRFGAAFVGDRLYPIAQVPKEIETKLENIKNRRATVAKIESVWSPRPALTLAESVPRSRVETEIPETGKFISADLEKMEITLYEDGKLLHTYPVISKGRPGSHWETPTGRYVINVMTPDHFSSIGQVHMPYSMQFYGNFFIHGWPYYPDGTPVGEGYSGGCIRLATEDAMKVFEFAEPGTPLYVHEIPKETDDTKLSRLAVDSDHLPKTQARAYFVADIESGDILLSQNARKSYPMASITKLMTAIVANEAIAYNRKIQIGNDRYILGDLYYPLMLRSNNLVAESMAENLGRKRFMNEMNAKAKALGMHSTNFEDASGLSPQNTASAWDLFYLARYLFEKKQFLLKISQTEEKTIEGADGRKWSMSNQNRFAKDDSFVGGKLGYTDEAMQTSLALFTAKLGGQDRVIAVIILGSPDWKRDTAAILQWLPDHSAPVDPYIPPAAAEMTDG